MLQIIIRVSPFLLGAARPAAVGWPRDLPAMLPRSHFPSYLFSPPNPLRDLRMATRAAGLVGAHEIHSDVLEKEQSWGSAGGRHGIPGTAAGGLSS